MLFIYVDITDWTCNGNTAKDAEIGHLSKIVDVHIWMGLTNTYPLCVGQNMFWLVFRLLKSSSVLLGHISAWVWRDLTNSYTSTQPPVPFDRLHTDLLIIGMHVHLGHFNNDLQTDSNSGKMGFYDPIASQAGRYRCLGVATQNGCWLFSMIVVLSTGEIDRISPQPAGSRRASLRSNQQTWGIHSIQTNKRNLGLSETGTKTTPFRPMKS